MCGFRRRRTAPGGSFAQPQGPRREVRERAEEAYVKQVDFEEPPVRVSFQGPPGSLDHEGPVDQPGTFEPKQGVFVLSGACPLFGRGEEETLVLTGQLSCA